jgi:hypothetical protein
MSKFSISYEENTWGPEKNYFFSPLALSFPLVTKNNMVPLKWSVLLPSVPIGPDWAPFPHTLCGLK